MPDPVLEFRGVVAGYGPTHVLRSIDISVGKGERLAIIGRNGAGKTTLLATAMGLTRMHGGEVWLKGTRVDSDPPFRRNAGGLGLVPQTRNIFPSLTVEENLRAAMRGDATLDEAYALFPRLKERRRNGGRQLSGGEQRMLAIARTLMSQPDVIMLDEPLEGLAPVICEQLMRAFEQLVKGGTRTVLLVEQHAEAALAFASRTIVMSNGAIVHEGPSNELRARPDLLHRHIGVALHT